MIINTQLAKNPINWIIVTTMLVIVGIAGHIILKAFGFSPSTAPGKGSAEQNTPASTPVTLRAGIDYAFAPASAGQ